MARDGSGPPLAFQLLEVPSLDLTGEIVREALATEELRPMASFVAERDTAVSRYLRDPGDAGAPLASPILADDLSGLPPAHIMTAEFDPLREEGERYARRLRESGVAATATRHAGAIHGTSFLTRVWEPARRWQHEAATVLARAQWRTAASPVSPAKERREKSWLKDPGAEKTLPHRARSRSTKSPSGPGCRSRPCPMS